MIIICLLSSLFNQYLAQSICPSGVATSFDGYQQPFIKAIELTSDSVYLIKAPLVKWSQRIDSTGVNTDLFMSIWVKNQAALPSGGILTCNQTSSLYSVAFGFSQQTTANGITSVMFQSLNYSQSGIPQSNMGAINRPVNYQRWNYLSVYLGNQSTLQLGFNGKVFINVTSPIQGLYQNLQTEFNETTGDQTHVCQFGGTSFNGYLRYYITAFGFNSHSSYVSTYMNSIPTAFDSHLLTYYPLQDSFAQVFFNDPDDFMTVMNVNFAQLYEPDQVCSCISSDTSSQTYVELSSYSQFSNSLTNITSGEITKITAFTINFTLFIEQYGPTTILPIFSHAVWNISLYQRRALQVLIQNQTLMFDFGSTIGAALFLNAWISYSLQVSQQSATLTLNDYTQPNISQSISLSQPLNINLSNTDDSFNILPSDTILLLRELNYSVNNQTVLKFSFTTDQFYFQTTNTNAGLLNQEIPWYSGSAGYFNFISSFGTQQLYSNSLRFKQLNGPCNQSDPTFAFDGVACKSKQTSLQLYDQGTSQGALKAFSYSTNSEFTIEVWFNFQGFILNGQNQATLFTNYLSNDAQVIYISIGQDTSGYSLQCEPFQSEQTFQGLDEPVILQNKVIKNNWMHMACISSTEGINQLSLVLYDSQSQTTSTQVQLQSSMINQPQTDPLVTMIGNNINYTEPLMGMLREMRIWNVARDITQILTFRFQTIPSSDQINLFAYSLLNLGYGQTVLYQTNDLDPSETDLLISQEQMGVIQWLTSTSSPLICPPDTLLNSNGTCCYLSDFWVSISSTYTQSVFNNVTQNVLQLYANIWYYSTNETLIDYNVYSFDWACLNVSGYQPQSSQYGNYLLVNQFISNNGDSRTIYLPRANLSDTAVYQFSVIVTSSVRNYEITQQAQLFVDPQCPSIQLYPQPDGQKQLIVTRSIDFTQLQLYLVLVTKCSNQTIEDSQIQWSIEPISTFTLSQNDTIINFQSIPSNTNQINVTGTLIYSDGTDVYALSDSLTILILDTNPYQLGLQQNRSSLLLQYGEDLTIDVSDSIYNVNYDLDSVLISLNCPDYIFDTDQLIETYCTIINEPNTYPAITIPYEALTPANYEMYLFSITMSSSVYNYTQVFNFTVQYSQPTTLHCPSVNLPAQSTFTRALDRFIITPQIFLECEVLDSNSQLSGIEYYQIDQFQWIIDGQNFPSSLNYSSDQLVAYIDKDYLSNVTLPYSQNISLTANVNGTWFNSTTLFTLSKSQVLIEIQSINQQQLWIVSFDQALIIDPTQSYDPDYPLDSISFSWSCISNTQPIASDSYANSNGVLVLRPYDRLISDFLINGYSTFTLQAYNPKYPDSTNTKTLKVFFQDLDQTLTTYQSCQLYLNVSNSLYFNQINSSDIYITPTLSTQCLNLNISTSGLFLISSDQAQTLQLNTGSTFMLTQDRINALDLNEWLSLEFIYIFDLENEPLKYSLLSNYTFPLVSQTLNIFMQATPLIVVMIDQSQDQQVQNNSIVKIGLQELFILDLSETYDPDDLSDQKIIFIIDCSGYNGLCDQTSSDIVEITQASIVQLGLNVIGSTFSMSIQAQSLISQKTSQVYTLNFKVVEQDLDQCFTFTLGGMNSSNIVTIYKSQAGSIRLQTYVQFSCDNMEIDSINWNLVTQVTQFWNISQSYNFLSISDLSLIPANVDSVQFNVLAIVNFLGQTNLIQGQQELNFTLNIEDGDITTVLEASSDIMEPTSEGIILTHSIEGQQIGVTSSCEWQCPLNVINQDVCSTSSCNLNLIAGQIQLLNPNDDYEQIQFTSTLTTSTGQVQTKSVIITLISSYVKYYLPRCSIENIKGDLFNVYDDMTYYAQCNFTLATINPSLYVINYQWNVSPTIPNLNLTTNKITITSAQSLTQLTKAYGVVSIQLSITLTNTQTGKVSPFNYSLFKMYDIPDFLGFNDLAQINPGLQMSVIPNQGYTLFTPFTLSLTNLILTPQQYIRIRVEKIQNQWETLFYKTFNTTFYLYLPKNTIQMYVDIIEGQSSYGEIQKIYTLYPSITLNDLSYLTLSVFNSQILPRVYKQQTLQTDVQSDQVESQLNELIQLATAISGLKQNYQQMYLPTIYSRLMITYSMFLSLEDIESQYDYFLESKILRVATLCYAGLGPEFDDNLTDLVFSNLLSSDSTAIIDEPIVLQETKQAYYRSIYNLLFVTNGTQLLSLRQSFQDIIALSMSPGSQVIYTLDQGLQTTLYMLSLSDFQQNLLLQFGSTNQVQIYPQNLPNATEYISITSIPVNISNFTSEVSPQAISSQILDIELFDLSDIELTNLNNLFIQMSFTLSNDLVNTLRYESNLNQMIACQSKSSLDSDFTNNVTTDLSAFSTNGIVRCNTTHLTQFQVTYINQNSTTTPQTLIQEQFMFEKLPILSLVLPVGFFSFTFIMAIVGGIISYLDKQRPLKRMYNKLTLSENIEKYSFTRLVGCMVLQFNPFFNYLLKPNFYLNRPVRLLLLTEYFLLISAASLAYFYQRPNELSMMKVFGLAIAMQLIIVVCRPLMQNCVFSLFYPKNLNQWKYVRRDQEQDEMIVERRRTLGDGEAQEDSVRLENSMNRMTPSQNTPRKQEDNVNGDEILKFRQQRQRRKSNDLTSNSKLKNTQEIELADLSQSHSKIKNKQDSRQNSQHKLTEQDNSVEVLDALHEGGEDENQDQVEQQQHLEQAAEIVLDSQEEDKTQEMHTPYGYQNKSHLLDETVNNFIPQKQKKRKRKIQDSMANQLNHQAEENPFDNQVNMDESTPSLENLYENYRELEKQKIDIMKQTMGIALLILVGGGLFGVHVYLLPRLYDNQFQNWFECTIYAFMTQVFVIDTMLYMMVALALKNLTQNRNQRSLCSWYSLFIRWPLGKYKMVELEIETSKLKEFDSDYESLLYI